MTWSDAMLTAFIAAVVSLIASLATYVATLRSMLHQREMQERDFERSFTEKLYELRLSAYPKAFAVTDQLRSEYVFGEGLSHELLTKVREELLEWHRSSAGFLLSKDALKAYYSIRDVLTLAPEDDAGYSRSQRKKLWERKNRFRSALKQDLNLMYQEEETPDARGD